MTEAGVAGVAVSSWSAFFVPARTPQDIIRKIHTDTVAALAEPAVRDKLEQSGVVVIGSTPDELASFLNSEMDKWGQVSQQRTSEPSDAAEPGGHASAAAGFQAWLWLRTV